MSDPLRKATEAEKSSIARAMVSAVLDLGTAIVDDGHDRYELPADVEPRIWGGVIGRLRVRGVIALAGRPLTARQKAKRRSIARWYAPDMDRARRYLASLGPEGSPPPPGHQMTLPVLDDEPETGGGI